MTLYGLLAVTNTNTEPRSREAVRRLTFFVNSLLMDMPRAPSLEHMMSWSVLTPFYAEDVIMTRADLLAKNSDGVTTLLYMQTLYKQDWLNFLQRRGIGEGADQAHAIWSKEHVMETRLWASFRAQTLARTVEGMMYYESALKLLGRLEGVPDHVADETVRHKFGYLVAAQVYGRMKKNADPKAQDMDYLLHRFPNLRVAYIDEVRLNREGETAYYSVLVRSGNEAAELAAAGGGRFGSFSGEDEGFYGGVDRGSSGSLGGGGGSSGQPLAMEVCLCCHGTTGGGARPRRRAVCPFVGSRGRVVAKTRPSSSTNSLTTRVVHFLSRTRSMNENQSDATHASFRCVALGCCNASSGDGGLPRQAAGQPRDR